jgi:glycosyltransferase involved in cell wall biosynthesis
MAGGAARPLLHVFPRFSRDAANSPYGDHLRATGANVRIIASDVSQAYPSRWQLLAFGYPKLVWSALRCAWASLYARQSPDAVLISSDVEALVFALVRGLPGAAKPAIFFMPFIFTERASSRLNTARLAYYRFVLRPVAGAICHSRLEIARYQQLFANTRTDFLFVPWGTHVPSVAEIDSHAPAERRDPDHIIAVAAGRSGRDYPTFAQAARLAGCEALIICNDMAALGGVQPGDGVTILSKCFGMDYLAQLLHATIVAVPLAVSDISAGQMVFIQAMALGKPLIVTETETITDYLTHEINALLVPRGDATAMADALRRLAQDPALRQSLGDAARSTYETRFSGAAHAAHIVTTVEGVLSRSHGAGKARGSAPGPR